MKAEFLLITSFLVAPGIAQEGIPDSSIISAERICSHIEQLADDSFLGRKPGTRGEEKTLEYIAGQFQQLGLEPGYNGGWFQPVRLREYTMIVPENIQVEAPGHTFRLTHRKDYYLGSTSDSARVRIMGAPVVFAGFGIHAPELGWDDYGELDVKGKVVVALADAPDQYTTDTTLWKGDTGANLYGQYFYKKNEAADRGALGLLVVFRDKGPGQLNWGILDRTSGQPKMTLPNEPGKPSLQFSGFIHREAAAKLFSTTGLNFEALQQAAVNAAFQAVNTELKLSFSFQSMHRDLVSNNVLALRKGRSRPDEVLIYSAHWDHEGINAPADGDSIYNGAVDNASGTAMLLEVARAFGEMETERSVLFLATTAEEMGLLGAIAYNRNPVFPHGNTVANFNMDAHFPYGRTGLAVGVVYGRSALDPYIDRAAAWTNRQVIPNPTNAETGVFFRSDHYPFIEKGIPSTFLVGAANPWDMAEAEHQEHMAGYMAKYHQPSDEFDVSFDCRGMAQDALLVFYTGWQLANNADFPKWHQDQPFHALREQSLNANQIPGQEPSNSLQGPSGSRPNARQE